ncbi:trehalose-phosphatase [Nocardioides jiangxiensis]|uniref:Trehalose 6-phosphate phosphatase n=1 Tax=Nocardioides jiangxiensis TaxID=3064524 RepID=A0ABT9AYV3_9ACTN|nr:trehalose-phosphatase [Nocardioides sp. WY-20]MDO7867762.1 trehalose-phosphatase [Nocardioides sp. WY-20]
MRFTSPDAMQRYAALARVAAGTVVGLDFDGTLAPIVEDPEKARIHPRGPGILLDLAAQVRGIAIVTGRPARQVVALGALDDLGTAFSDQGRELQVFGQYGNERWSSRDRRVLGPRPPHGLASFLGELPRILRRCDAADAYVEDKGLAVAVHTRRLEAPEAAFQRLLPELAIAAERHGMKVEPGRQVIEIRAPGADKGDVVQKLAHDLGALGVCFVGDDLGDLDAFHAVQALREDGMTTLLVCSASDEESALVPLSDVVVAGPDGVLQFLATLARDAAASARSEE